MAEPLLIHQLHWLQSFNISPFGNTESRTHRVSRLWGEKKPSFSTSFFSISPSYIVLSSEFIFYCAELTTGENPSCECGLLSAAVENVSHLIIHILFVGNKVFRIVPSKPQLLCLRFLRENMEVCCNSSCLFVIFGNNAEVGSVILHKSASGLLWYVSLPFIISCLVQRRRRNKLGGRKKSRTEWMERRGDKEIKGMGRKR